MNLITAAVPLTLRIRKSSPVPPSRQDDATINLYIEYSGGLGRPGAVIFVPIFKEGDRWKVFFKKGPPPSQELRLHDVAQLNSQPTSDYESCEASSTRSEWKAAHATVPWPFDTEWVLVLLLCRQFRDVGGYQPQAVVTGVAGRSPVINGEDWLDVKTAVDDFLKNSSADKVEKGCIKGPLKTP
jgi:hypothetical protein